MRSYSELRQILVLWEAGKSKKGISLELDIPRATVRDCIYKLSPIFHGLPRLDEQLNYHKVPHGLLEWNFILRLLHTQTKNGGIKWKHRSPADAGLCRL